MSGSPDTDNGSGLPEDDTPLGQTETPPPAAEPASTPAPPSAEEMTSDVGDNGEQETEAQRRIRNRGPNPHTELTNPATSPLKANTRLGEKDALSILAVDTPELNALSDGYPNLDVSQSPEGEEWLERVSEAQQYFQRGGALLETLVRPDSLYRQSVTVGAEQIMAHRPKFEPAEGGQKLQGEQAMMRMQALLGLGAVVRIPLWHTGIWVTLKAPTEAALLELDRRIGNEKILLGRQSNGLIFSSTSVYSISYLVNFALAHIYEATVKYNDTAELKKIIRCTDIPTLLWGLICTIYPQGYPFRQPCVVDPTKCTHITEELLNLGKLSWTNDRALTDWQRQLMRRKTAKFTPEELERYQSEHRFNEHATVKLSDKVGMELKVPTLEEYELSGFAWVDGIVNQIDKAFGGTVKGEERNRYILEQGQMTALRQYGHWIARLVLNGNEVIDDASTIETTIGTLTSSEELYTAFFNGIGKFIDNTTISLIAIPKFNCPSCGKPQSDEEKQHPHLIVLDVVQIFFTLLDHRITKVLERMGR